jgi:hypothetical protein
MDRQPRRRWCNIVHDQVGGGNKVIEHILLWVSFRLRAARRTHTTAGWRTRRRHLLEQKGDPDERGIRHVY